MRRFALLAVLSSCTGLLSGADAGADAGGSDAGAADAGALEDAGTPPDSGTPDAGLTDAGSGIGTTWGDFLGVNAFIDDPLNLLTPIGNVREYHNWSWNEGNGDPGYPGYPNGQSSFVMFGGYWSWDRYYAGLADAGVFGFPAVQGGVPWIQSGKVPPIPAGADPEVPGAYAAHADFVFQLAARYGARHVDDAKLKLAADQTRVSGLGTLRYLEDWNEQDATWVLPGGRNLFLPSEYAAMASADYDGDQGRMGTTAGVKNADPALKLVMGGLAGSGADTPAWERSIETYLDGMRAWAGAHRDGGFPADVINVHHYSFGPDGFGVPNPRPAITPEQDGLEATARLLVQYRDRVLPGKELWMTELGYDTDSQSNLRAPPIGRNSAEIVQGQWIVRTYLALMGAGFDRAFVFVLRDGCEGTNCHTQFDTCGLTTVKDKWVPKASYFFLATLRARLATFGFTGEIASGAANVRVQTFREAGSARRAWILWAPTSADTVVPGYALDVGAAAGVKVVRLAPMQLSGVESPLTVSQGQVTLDVDETPAIVIAD